MGESRLPLVSIVTPSYNQGQFIEDNILSVKNQDYPNIEHIIIDGGSTDHTLDVLKKYEGTYNMQWVSEPDEGQSDAINKGIDIASGRIIGWLNSDDVYIFRSNISKVVRAFQKDRNTDIIFGDLAFINKESKILRFYVYRNFSYDKLIQYRYNLGQPAVFFKATVLKENKIRKDLHYVMDYELWLRLGKKYEFNHLSEVIAGFRVYPEAKSSIEKDSKLFRERQKVLSDYGITKKNGCITCITDKILRGGNARLRGFARMMKCRYIFNKDKLAFNGEYLDFPHDLIQQLLGKVDSGN